MEEFEDLWDLDDGGGCYDGEAEGFADGEGEAFGASSNVEVEEQGTVAGFAEEGYEGVVERGGEVGA